MRTYFPAEKLQRDRMEDAEHAGDSQIREELQQPQCLVQQALLREMLVDKQTQREEARLGDGGGRGYCAVNISFLTDSDTVVCTLNHGHIISTGVN